MLDPSNPEVFESLEILLKPPQGHEIVDLIQLTASRIDTHTLDISPQILDSEREIISSNLREAAEEMDHDFTQYQNLSYEDFYERVAGRVGLNEETLHYIELTLSKRHQEITEAYIRGAQALAEKLAITDPLTGIDNRLGYERKFDQLLSHFQKSSNNNYQIAYILFDTDSFKLINDKFGHPSGDIVLHSIAQRIQNAIRSVENQLFEETERNDILARLGGDEFVLILDKLPNDLSIERIVTIIDRIRDSVGSNPISDGKNSIYASLSAGAVIINKENQHNYSSKEAIYEAADKALYTAKETRDRLSVHSPITTPSPTPA